ncbi:MAG: hypothetical protein KDD35_06455, partial [Bdellovibrionales bacterium]|nr:hypothetical protein [Bdellovibrionales bacterium]
MERVGTLDCVVVPGDEKGPLVVLFHGYGADCWDLISLREELDLPEATWVFPNGILEVPVGPGWMGRAWTEIDLEAINSAFAAGTHRDFSQIRPPGMDRALEASLSLFKNLDLESYSQVIVGGFSQGAMLTLEIILSSFLPVSAAILLSGTLIDEGNWRSKVELRPPIPFFQSHGSQDQVLAYSAAQKLEQLLRKAGWKGHLRSFKGGHEIPRSVVGELRSFIGEIVKPS